MKVEVKKLPKCQTELSISIDASEMEPFLEQAAKDISQSLNIPGFRKGHVPRNIVVKEVGEFALLEQASRKAIIKFYVQAITEKKIEAIAQPEIKMEKLVPGNPVEFKAIVSYLAEFELPDYNKISVKKKEPKVEKEKIDEMLENLRKSRAKTTEVKREVKSGDAIEVNFRTYLNKVAVDKGESKNHPLVIGEGQFVPGFEDELIGMKAGDKKEFSVRFPKKYHQKNLADRDVEFKVEMIKVSERELPEINDEFVKSLGQFKDLKDLKAKFEENLKKEAQQKEKARLEEEMLEKIAEKAEIDIPEVLVKGEIDKMVSELKSMVQSQGGEFDKYLESMKKTEEEMRKEFRGKALKRAKYGLILREVAKTEKIEADDKEVEEERSKTLAQYQHDKKAMKQIQSPEYEDYTRTLIQNRKVFEHLVKVMVK